MARTNKWWEDKDYLEKHNLSSMYDVMTDRVRFAYQVIEPSSKLIVYHATYDVEALEYFSINDVISEFERGIKNMPQYRHPGPTNQELQKYPALDAAWREFQIIQRLTIGEYYDKNR